MSVEYLSEFSCEGSIVSSRVEWKIKGDIKYENIGKCVNDLNWLSSNTNVRIIYYLNLCFQLENNFNEKDRKFQNRIEQIRQKITDNKRDDPEENEIVSSRFLEQQQLFYERFDVQENAVSMGIFLKSYTLLEDVLNQMCLIYEKLRNPGFNYKNLKGGGIVRANYYIKKVVGINLDNDPDWEQVKNWNKIRNQLMHEDGKVNKENKQVKKAMDQLGLKSMRDFTVTDSNVISIKLNDVKSFLILMDSIFSKYVLHEDKWIVE